MNTLHVYYTGTSIFNVSRSTNTASLQKNMGRRKRSVLARTDNLKKNKDSDENSVKKQKYDHPLPRPVKENANVSFGSA
jgi:hypothetical protein